MGFFNRMLVRTLIANSAMAVEYGMGVGMLVCISRSGDSYSPSHTEPQSVEAVYLALHACRGTHIKVPLNMHG